MDDALASRLPRLPAHASLNRSPLRDGRRDPRAAARVQRGARRARRSGGSSSARSRDCSRATRTARAIFVADTKAWRRRALSPATLAEVRALRRQLRAFAPDHTIDVQGLWKSALVARMAGGPGRGIRRGATPRADPRPCSATCAVEPGPDARHVVDRNLALLSAVGIPAAARAPDAAYLLARPSPEADAFLAAQPRPFAVFHPGAGREDKTWGEERFATLAAALHAQRGLHPVISWGPGDERRAERLAALAAGRVPAAAARLSRPRAADRRGASLRRRRHRAAPPRRRARRADAGALRPDGPAAQRTVPGSEVCRRAHGQRHGRGGPRASAGRVPVTRSRAAPL